MRYPSCSLAPVQPIGDDPMPGVIRVHRPWRKFTADVFDEPRARTLKLLRLLGPPEPGVRAAYALNLPAAELTQKLRRDQGLGDLVSAGAHRDRLPQIGGMGLKSLDLVHEPSVC